MTTATVLLPVPAGAGTRLLGEVIAWACPGVSVTHSALVRALEDAGLDPGVARELAPRHAFSRACKRLSDQRIIRPVSEDADAVKFQFTQESREGDHYEYKLETTLTLNKQTGTVTCELPGLATLAQIEASPDAVIAPLKAALQSQADKVLASAAKDEIKDREVTILGDRNTPYKVLRKVMATATEAEYGKVSLAVIERESVGTAQATARTASLTREPV